MGKSDAKRGEEWMEVSVVGSFREEPFKSFVDYYLSPRRRKVIVTLQPSSFIHLTLFGLISVNVHTPFLCSSLSSSSSPMANAVVLIY